MFVVITGRITGLRSFGNYGVRGRKATSLIKRTGKVRVVYVKL